MNRRIALYARYSSELQSPTSIVDQFALCRDFAERQDGWAVVATFEDRALSGFGVAHRDGYQRLLAAALSSPAPFDVVLVEDLSRLTRDLSEILRLSRRLELNGVEIVGASDGIATGRHGADLQLKVKGLVNDLYLTDLRDKTHRGLAGSIARGLSAGGRIFGYHTVALPQEGRPGKRTTPARFEIDEAEAEIVRRIFHDYAAGRSMPAIAHVLNVEGVPFPAKDICSRASCGVGYAERAWSGKPLRRSVGPTCTATGPTPAPSPKTRARLSARTASGIGRTAWRPRSSRGSVRR